MKYKRGNLVLLEFEDRYVFATIKAVYVDNAAKRKLVYYEVEFKNRLGNTVKHLITPDKSEPYKIVKEL